MTTYTFSELFTFTRSTTATFVGSNGLIQTAAINAPRFDYDPVTLAPKGLLVEEQRVNVLLRSEEFNTAPWIRNAVGTATAPVLTANSAIAPDGTMTATLGVFDRGAGTGADRSSLSQTVSVSAGTYTQSMWLKAATPDDVGKQIAIRSVGGSSYLIINLTATWERYTKTEVQATSAYEIVNRQGFTADTTVSLLIWGAQLELGAFATSYIPTVASQVTRAPDQCAIVAPNFAPWYNQSEGTLVSEFSSFSPTSASNAAWTISDETNSNRWFAFAVSSTIRSFMATGGVTQASIDVGTYAANTVFKSAFAISANSVQSAVNGTLGTEDTTATVPTVVRLTVGASAIATTNFLNGHIRSVQYYPVRLADFQLQALSA
jgi:hypothetical protein